MSKNSANPLLVPQFCVRFNDIDNVGVTLRHYTGFVMIGQHAFYPPNEFSQDKFLSDLYDWLNIDWAYPEEIIFHEMHGWWRKLWAMYGIFL